jgi:hypothetical protein
MLDQIPGDRDVIGPRGQQVAPERFQHFVPIDPMPAPAPGEIAEQALAQQVAGCHRRQRPNVSEMPRCAPVEPRRVSQALA